jgi:hypothetical protein
MSQRAADMKKLAMAWKNAGPALRSMRHADIRREDNATAILALNSLFREAMKRSPPRMTSGFVEMYKILARQTKRVRR